MSCSAAPSDVQASEAKSTPEKGPSSIMFDLLPRWKGHEEIMSRVAIAIEKVSHLQGQHLKNNENSRSSGPTSSTGNAQSPHGGHEGVAEPGDSLNCNQLTRSALNNLPWEFETTKEAYREWAAMNR